MTTKTSSYTPTPAQILESQLFERKGNLIADKVQVLANRIHANWQDVARSSGLHERWKDIKMLSEEALAVYVRNHPEATRKGSTFFQVNILALRNQELPQEHQTENLRSAAHALGAWNALLSSFEPSSLKKQLTNILDVFKQLPEDALSKDAEEIGWIDDLMDKQETDFIKEEFNALILTASKIHDAWIDRASSWLDPSSLQARSFFELNNYNQRADLVILEALADL
jgi:hypothetical protein